MLFLALERQLQTRRDPETLQSHGILPRKFSENLTFFLRLLF